MQLVNYIVSLPFKLFTVIKSGVWIKGVYYRSNVKVPQSNTLKTFGEIISSTIKCSGKGNHIVVKGKLLHSIIRIAGQNNQIILDEGGMVSYSNILIRANNAHLYIGKRTDLLSVTIICQGSENYIEIGDDCLFSRNIDIWNSDTHTILNDKGTIINYSAPVKIGNHVWVGKHVRILKGVTIGNDTVIGMNSIVTNDIPPNSIAAGSPAKIIKININWSKELHQLTMLE